MPSVDAAKKGLENAYRERGARLARAWDNGKGFTLEQIAKMEGLTKGRISQIIQEHEKHVRALEAQNGDTPQDGPA